MADSRAQQALADAVEGTIQENPEAVRKWLAGEGGSWGFLAGKAVVALRRRLGRKLEEQERREVWDLLWERLVELKRNAIPGS